MMDIINRIVKIPVPDKAPEETKKPAKGKGKK